MFFIIFKKVYKNISFKIILSEVIVSIVFALPIDLPVSCPWKNDSRDTSVIGNTPLSSIERAMDTFAGVKCVSTE